MGIETSSLAIDEDVRLEQLHYIMMSLFRAAAEFEIEFVPDELLKASIKINDLKLVLMTRMENWQPIVNGDDDGRSYGIWITDENNEDVFATITQGGMTWAPIYSAGPWEEILYAHADDMIVRSALVNSPSSASIH